MSNTRWIKGDRTRVEEMMQLLGKEQWDAVFDNNGRELSDSKVYGIFRSICGLYILMSWI